MGTRAAFIIGDPVMDNKDCHAVGYICWDGYAEAFPELAEAKTTEQFVELVHKHVKDKRDDWQDPNDGFPFPWANDLFLTDTVFCFFEGRAWVEVNRYQVELSDYLTWDREDGGKLDQFYDRPRGPLQNINAPAAYNPRMDAGFLVFRAK